MKCPVCKTVDLVMTDRQGIEIDYCPNCRGVWLDRGELDKLIERAMMSEAPRSAPVQPPPAPRQGSYEVGQYGGGNPGYSQQPPPQQSQRRYDDDLDYDDYFEKRKRDGYHGDERYHPNDPRYKKKKSVLGEIFDIFGD
ncbi:MAG: zf-TFIIB domain-containing protein [bacterium]|nr:zf-TFIIB domain-containing protein [bacterium]